MTAWNSYYAKHRSLYNLGQEMRENGNVLGAQDRVPSGLALMTTTATFLLSSINSPLFLQRL